MIKTIVLASGNQGKVRELNALFNEPRIQLVSMQGMVAPGFEVEESGDTFEANAWLKAIAVCEATGLPALADDSGLEVDALHGRPGVHSARYAGPGATDAANNALLVSEMANLPEPDRGARFRCVLALAAPSASGVIRIASASGSVEGRIIDKERGQNGFGYDSLFEQFEWPGLTTAEISPEQKNHISHRARAAAALLGSLRAWLDEAATG